MNGFAIFYPCSSLTFLRPVFERKYWFTITSRLFKQSASSLFDSPSTHPHLLALLKGASLDQAASNQRYRYA
jgi:hypothetical protein